MPRKILRGARKMKGNDSMPMISASRNFQSSVNIAFDFDNAEKIQGFIPTADSMQFFKEIIAAADSKGQPSRAGILIGAYGKGKSYMMLEALSILYNSPKNQKALRSLAENVRKKDAGCAVEIERYLSSKKRLLPIVINGNSSSLSQSFLVALRSALQRKELLGLMPQTHFDAALNRIEKWEKEFPETYKKFKREISTSPQEFKAALRNFDGNFYEEFEKIYPTLTSGSEFNPFDGFDVVHLYESALEKISGKGFNGLFVVYDEFGKYLESSISKATIRDVKLLQDFAECADRTSAKQLHLMLICHKEIENYIDQLPKQKVDGWKGVSERFRHIRLYNASSEIYSLISAAIVKSPNLWESFCKKHLAEFENLKREWRSRRAFSEMDDPTFEEILRGSYPLHPLCAYMLPKISEKVAQNERTLFTFLSGRENRCFGKLVAKLEFEKGNSFPLLSPDILFDYFEDALRSESFQSEIRKRYVEASKVLAALKPNEKLEAKIVKTLAMIYVLNQFERIPPKAEWIREIFRDCGLEFSEIEAALKNLSGKFLYENAHNRYFVLKENSEIDIGKKISDEIAKRKSRISVEAILNEFPFEKFLFPISYNIEKKMTRYFAVRFISEGKFLSLENENSLDGDADGILWAVVANENPCAEKSLLEKAKTLSSADKNCLVILSKERKNFERTLRKFDAVSALRQSATSDVTLFSEYDLVYRDLFEVVKNFVLDYLRPERNRSTFICDGNVQQIFRKSELSLLLSKKCESLFPETPVVNNEMINKNVLTGIAEKSRAKLIHGILNSSDATLGLLGSGQEISFRNSLLVMSGILSGNSESPKVFCEDPAGESGKNFGKLFRRIDRFVESSARKEKSFSELIENLVSKKNKIGMRRGLIPVYLAVAFSKNADRITIRNVQGEAPLNAETLAGVVENPGEWTLRIQEWNDAKKRYVAEMEKLFADFLVFDERKNPGFGYLAAAILRWYRSLPQYARQQKILYLGNEKVEKLDRCFVSWMNLLKNGIWNEKEILFEKIPGCFGAEADAAVVCEIERAKKFFECSIAEFKQRLVEDSKQILCENPKKENSAKSLKSCIEAFVAKLDPKIGEHLFENQAHQLWEIYAAAKNDEVEIVEKMAKVLTGLSIEDWNDDSLKLYRKNLSALNQTLLSYRQKVSANESGEYRIEFFDAAGKPLQKAFRKIPCSSRAQNLESELLRTFDEMGGSVSDAEKRQILVNILGKLCLEGA